MSENEITISTEQAEASAAGKKSGFWQLPNSFYKTVRQMGKNELRSKVMELAAAMIDQRNANYILSEKLKAAELEVKELKGATNV